MIAGLRLTPRQTRLALDMATGAVVISVAFALAGLTWRIAGHAGTGAVTVPSGKSAPGAAPGIGPAVALAPFGKAADGGASQPTGLPLQLLGIISAEPASLSSAFIAVSGQPAAPFAIGQSVGGATIQAILRDRVILNNAGRAEYLTFPDPAQTQPAAAATPPSALQAPGTVPVGPAPPAAAKAPPADPAQAIGPLMQRLGASRADGGGYRIGSSAIPGLQPGDVLLSLNGTPLSDPTAAGAAYAGAQASGSATLVVSRDGKQLTLTIPLR